MNGCSAAFGVNTGMIRPIPCDVSAPSGYPRIVEGPTLKAVEKDRNTVMICSATGNPEPTITWLKDFIPVDLSDPRIKLLHTGELRCCYTVQIRYSFMHRLFVRSFVGSFVGSFVRSFVRSPLDVASLQGPYLER